MSNRINLCFGYLNLFWTAVTLETSSLEDISATIRIVATGASVIPECIGAKLFDQVREFKNSVCILGGNDGHVLTPREYDVAFLAANALTNKQIASKLCIDEDTVKTHMRSILRKLGVRNRVHLAASGLFKKREGGSTNAA